MITFATPHAGRRADDQHEGQDRRARGAVDADHREPGEGDAGARELLAPRPLVQHERRRSDREEHLELEQQRRQPDGQSDVQADEHQPELDDAEHEAEAPTMLQGTGGRPTKNTAGSAISVKRSALNSSGGKCSSPTWMTTKFTPQSAATSHDERDGACGHTAHPAAANRQSQ